eukprot:1138274-Pelagomonas_calceolata.AAC.1
MGSPEQQRVMGMVNGLHARGGAAVWGGVGRCMFATPSKHCEGCVNTVAMKGSKLCSVQNGCGMKGNSTPAKTPRALRKGSLTSKLARVSPKGPQT